MKRKTKYSLLAIVAIVILCAFTYSNREGGQIPTDAEQMEIQHFHGHTYVCYRFYKAKSNGYGFTYGYGGASIVHDPDCKCRK